MKKTILITILFLTVSGIFAQVESTKLSKDVYTKYEILSPEGIARLEFDSNRDTVHIYYWQYRYAGNDLINARLKRDCYIPYSNRDGLIDLYKKFNAWIRKSYNIE